MFSFPVTLTLTLTLYCRIFMHRYLSVVQAVSVVRVTWGGGWFFAPAGHYCTWVPPLTDSWKWPNCLIPCGHFSYSADSWGFLFLSYSCSSLIVRTQFFHSALCLLPPSLSLLVIHTHTHFLTLTVGQQILPSFISKLVLNKKGWVRDACTSKWWFRHRGRSLSLEHLRPLISYWHYIATPC